VGEVVVVVVELEVEVRVELEDCEEVAAPPLKRLITEV
jgi:hypothetical protein